MNWRDHITVDPAVCHGAACFRKTRVMVAVVLDSLADGRTPDQILADYPSLTPDAMPAAIAFAADLARERILKLPGSDAA